MQRHPTLRDLSSDHHSGLVLARRARRAADWDPETRAGAWAAVVEHFRRELEPHFLREERGLLSALGRAGETALVERALREHAALRRLIVADRAEGLAKFAESLVAHIRFEEKVLFERAQKLLDLERLADLESE